MSIHIAAILEGGGTALVVGAALWRALTKLTREITALRKVAQSELTPNSPAEKAEHGPSVADNVALMASEMEGMSAAFAEHISDGHGGHYFRAGRTR
jgi:hypothetical protein